MPQRIVFCRRVHSPVAQQHFPFQHLPHWLDTILLRHQLILQLLIWTFRLLCKFSFQLSPTLLCHNYVWQSDISLWNTNMANFESKWETFEKKIIINWMKLWFYLKSMAACVPWKWLKTFCTRLRSVEFAHVSNHTIDCFRQLPIVRTVNVLLDANW